MVNIALNIARLKEQIPPNVKIVAVSKTKPVTDIKIAYEAGHRVFGENRVQELLAKKDSLPSDIEWHLIGHLQSNKVKYIVPFISMIQSVDTFKLLFEINKEAEKVKRKIDCLLQFHIAQEETKYGFDFGEVSEMMESENFIKLLNVNIRGVMGMASFTADMNIVHKEFEALRNNFNALKNNYFSKSDQFTEISMGMSGDYLAGIEEGTTIVRIGSLIFGERSKKSD
jgi:pyridoxal phosphate enzyme (YggS family)